MQVLIPGPLRSYTGGARIVALELESPTPALADALLQLDARFPGFRFRIIDEQGAIRPHIKLFVDGVLARSLAERMKPGAELMIVGALSGG
jgi:sulfur-carrier protein